MSEPSEELDDPQVLKQLLWRFTISAMVALPCAGLGAAFVYMFLPLIIAIKLRFFIESTPSWGPFLWLELGALLFGLTGFVLCWKKIKTKQRT